MTSWHSRHHVPATSRPTISTGPRRTHRGNPKGQPGPHAAPGRSRPLDRISTTAPSGTLFTSSWPLAHRSRTTARFGHVRRSHERHPSKPVRGPVARARTAGRSPVRSGFHSPRSGSDRPFKKEVFTPSLGSAPLRGWVSGAARPSCKKAPSGFMTKPSFRSLSGGPCTPPGRSARNGRPVRSRSRVTINTYRAVHA